MRRPFFLSFLLFGCSGVLPASMLSFRGIDAVQGNSGEQHCSCPAAAVAPLSSETLSQLGFNRREAGFVHLRAGVSGLARPDHVRFFTEDPVSIFAETKHAGFSPHRSADALPAMPHPAHQPRRVTAEIRIPVHTLADDPVAVATVAQGGARGHRSSPVTPRVEPIVFTMAGAVLLTASLLLRQRAI